MNEAKTYAGTTLGEVLTNARQQCSSYLRANEYKVDAFRRIYPSLGRKNGKGQGGEVCWIGRDFIFSHVNGGSTPTDYVDSYTKEDLESGGVGELSDCIDLESDNVVASILCRYVFSAGSETECVKECPTNSTYNATTKACVCNSGYNESASGNCIKCTGGMVFNSTTKTCECPSGQINTAYGCKTPCEVGMYYSGNELECSYSKDTYKIIETSCSGAGITYIDESFMDPEFRAKDTVVQLVYNAAKNNCGGDKYNLPDTTWARMIADEYGVSCIVVRDGIYVNGTIVKDMNLSVDDKGTTAISPCIEGDNIQAYMPCVTYKDGCI